MPANSLLLQLSLCVPECYLSLISAFLPLISQGRFVETNTVFLSEKIQSRLANTVERRESVTTASRATLLVKLTP